MAETDPSVRAEPIAGAGEESDEQFRLAYAELRSLAASFLRAERRDHTLQPTALVHEAWLRLAGQHRAVIHDRRHFLAVAATAMRRLLVDHARARNAVKRRRPPDLALTVSGPEPGIPPLDLLALDEALDRLHALSERQARVVEMRCFAGLPVEDVAVILEVSPGTVKGDWRHARAWLRRELGDERTPPRVEVSA